MGPAAARDMGQSSSSSLSSLFFPADHCEDGWKDVSGRERKRFEEALAARFDRRGQLFALFLCLRRREIQLPRELREMVSRYVLRGETPAMTSTRLIPAKRAWFRAFEILLRDQGEAQLIEIYRTGLAEIVPDEAIRRRL